MVFALASGGLFLAWQRGRLGIASVVLFAAALVVWALEFAALATQFRGADGFASCGSDCSTVHYVSAMAFLAPPLLISLAALAMIVAMGSRIRVRRARAREAAG